MPNNVYWYLSGDAKRRMIERDIKKELKDLKNETNKKLDNLSSELINNNITYIKEISLQTLNNSVKPNVKVPFKTKKVKVSKKALAVGACVFMIAGGVATPTIIRIAKNIPTINKEEHFLSEENDIIKIAKNVSEDPIVVLYFAVNALDSWCRNNNIDSYLYYFNKIYKTNYESIDDFLFKNNFKDKVAWKSYVGNKLIEEKEQHLNGYYNVRGL